MAEPQTLFDKIWSAHAIRTRQDGATLLHIDRHLVHDGSSNAFRMLGQRNLPVRRPDRTFATPDHYVATLGRGLSAINDPNRRSMVEDLEVHARTTGVTLFGLLFTPVFYVAVRWIGERLGSNSTTPPA